MPGDAREGCGTNQEASPGAQCGAGNRSPAQEHTLSAGCSLVLPEIPSLRWALGWLRERHFF